MPGKTTVPCTHEQYETLISVIFAGVDTYIMPNPRVATLLEVQANTGLRIGDILLLKMNSFIMDRDKYRFDMVEEKTGKNALEQFNAAMENVMPVLEVKARRVGGSTYQVPMEVRAERRQTLGLRWLTAYARTRGEKTMSERLANEIMDAINSTGGAFKKKEETHRMAEANKAFAHYRY